MHHAGHITLLNSSFEGGGDDGFNVHGNFIVLKDIEQDIDRLGPAEAGAAEGAARFPRVSYIDETGPGWITAAPTYFIGDAVEFYSRRTLQKLGSNIVRSATASEIVFEQSLPTELKKFDMLLSLRRIASLTIEGCFFGNSNSRGAVVSSVNCTIRNNTFANLTHPAVIFIEGGCGANAGDYTEGPFSRNVLVEKNLFVNVATVGMSAASVNNLAMLQLTGCHPIGECGLTGQIPTNTGPTLQPPGGGIMRAVQIAFPSSFGANLHTLKFQAKHAGSLYGVSMGVYESSADGSHPTKLLGSTAGTAWKRGRDGSWNEAPITVSGSDGGGNLTLQNGTFWLALWYPSTTTLSMVSIPSGRMQYKSWVTAEGLQPSIGANWSGWQTHWYQGLPLAIEWDAVGGWCDLGGTLPPPVVSHAGDDGAGKITEPGAFVEQGSVFSNITIRANDFIALTTPTRSQAKSWPNSFLHIGVVDGLTIESNRMVHVAGAARAAPDAVLYSNSRVRMGGEHVLQWHGTKEVRIFQ